MAIVSLVPPDDSRCLELTQGSLTRRLNSPAESGRLRNDPDHLNLSVSLGWPKFRPSLG
jgi:hypothetical protein